MEAAQVEESEEIVALREQRRQLREQIEAQRRGRDEVMQSLKHLVPDLVSSLELSLKVVSSFQEKKHGERILGRRHVGGTAVTAQPQALEPSATGGHGKKAATLEGTMAPAARRSNHSSEKLATMPPEKAPRSSKLDEKADGERGAGVPDAPGGATSDASSLPGALSILKRVVASCLLAPSTSVPIDSAGLHRRLPKDLTPPEKNALAKVGGEKGGIAAVETALRALAEENSVIEVEEFVLSGKSRLMVLGMDRNRLAKELPGPLVQHRFGEEASLNLQGLVQSGSIVDGSGTSFAMSPIPPRPDVWSGEPHMQGTPPLPGPGTPMFQPGPPPMMGPRGGPRMMGMLGMSPSVPGMPLGFGGMPPMQRPAIVPGPVPAPGPQAVPVKNKNSEDEDLKDLEALLSKKSFKEMQKSKTGEELLDLLHRPTAKETAVAAKFKTKGGSVLKEYCPSLTKEDCRRQRNSYVACEKVHFRRIIAPHTDVNLGDCSFLDTCRHMKTCKYVHYELDPTPDVPGIMMGTRSLPPQRPLKMPRAEYCSEVELGEPQWINCDIRTFRMDILGQFGVIMADPPWDIHMELPYGTMSDDEMRNLNVPALQTDGLIFLWVTGRAMELGRECLELWGYKRVEELIWVKTNQLQRIIRTGRTGHWLNHSKEHCLVGIKGHPEVNRNIDTDVLVAEVRETSRKPDEMYPMLERISPRTRKLELFARMHNTHAGWISLGNQLDGVRLVDDGLRARFRAAYPDVDIQPPDPHIKSNISEVEVNTQEVSPPGITPKVTTETTNNAILESGGIEEKLSAQDTEAC